MRPQGVLFDFDGTLADSFDAIIASTNHVRRHFGYTELPGEQIRRLVGLGLAQLMRDVVPQVLPDEAIAVYRSHHPTVMQSGTRLFPGVAETLAELQRRGYRLAVCSNKAVAFTRQLVQHLGVADYFREVLGPEEVGGQAKPHPAMLQLAMQRLNLPPTATLYVGDMIVDIQTARAAGVPVWIVTTGTQEPALLQAQQPDRLLANLPELLHWLP